MNRLIDRGQCQIPATRCRCDNFFDRVGKDCITTHTVVDGEALRRTGVIEVDEQLYISVKLTGYVGAN